MCPQYENALGTSVGGAKDEVAVVAAFHSALQSGQFPNVQSLDMFGSALRDDNSLGDLYVNKDSDPLCGNFEYFEQILQFDIMAYSTHAFPSPLLPRTTRWKTSVCASSSQIFSATQRIGC